MHFVGAPLAPGHAYLPASSLDRGEPPVPTSFTFAGDTFHVARVVRSWRSTNTDRGETYLARHWYELALANGRLAVAYFDRKAKPGKPRWWLYKIDDENPDADVDARPTVGVDRPQTARGV